MTKPAFTSKPVVIAIGATDFSFTPSVTDANNHANELTMNNKVVPAYNYLTRTVAPEQKDELKHYLDNVPGLTLELYQMVSENAKGDITITLKN